MSGPIVLGILIVTIFLLVKYRVPVKDFFTGTPATAPVVTASVTTPRWSAKYLWSILIVLVGIALVAWGYKNTKIQPADVGSRSREYWLALLILWGIVAALIWLNAEKATAKTLQWVLAGVVAMLLVGFPVAGLVAGLGDDGHRQTRAQARVEQPPQKQMVSMPANGDSARVTVPVGYGTLFTGSGFVLLCFYTDGTEDVGTSAHPCKRGPVSHQVVRDTSGQPNSVVYEFVRAQ
jgi:hypothetical protein